MGEEEPTFEVRTQVNGKPTWRPASALATGSPRRESTSQESRSSHDEGDDQRQQDLGGEAALDRSNNLKKEGDDAGGHEHHTKS